MAKAACSEAEFKSLWEATGGSATRVAELLKVDVRAVHKRRRSIESAGEKLLSVQPNSPDLVMIGPENTYIRRNRMDLPSGRVVMFTDAHFFPGVRTTAYRGLIKLLPELSPDVVIDNGDSFDGGQISRHSRIGWDKRPTVKQELEVNKEYHDEIEVAAKGAAKFWNWGNHDLRYPTRLAALVSEFEGIPHFRLEDSFPRWKFGISTTFNPGARVPLLVKHRFKGGDHADWNNVMRAGIHIATGHDHQLGVRRFVDKRGARFGARAGTLSDTGLPIFDYQEDNPSQQAAGFLVFTFHKSELLCPEQVEVISPDEVSFRGKVYSV